MWRGAGGGGDGQLWVVVLCYWTALIYFKRFFITNSLADHDPDLLIVTCIFLAGKIEEYRISLHQLCDMIENATAPKPHAPGIGQIRVTAAKVMECELGLLAGLRFNLIVYHPHRSFRGFTADWCKFAESNKIRQPDADALIRTGNKFLHEVMLTDVPLIYTPGQIALAALHHVLTTVEPFSSDKELLSSHQKYINAKLCKVPWLPQLTTSVIPSILAMVSPQSRNPTHH
ncbi:cyclin H [Pelomyxa schiedti]|nr:cyclin H [Pelomyxa schiedti]